MTGLTRRPDGGGEIRPLWCAHAPTLAALQDCLARQGFADTASWLVADVSLGAWRGHQVATELCLQLGVAPPRRTWPSLAGLDRGPSFAELIGHGIDAESRGDLSALIALEVLDRISAPLRSSARHIVVVLAPCGGLSWEPEDLLFVRLLAARLGDATDIVLAYLDPPSPDDEPLASATTEWLTTPSSRQPVERPLEPVTMVPGIVEPATAHALGFRFDATDRRAPVVALPGGFFLVAPEFRRLPRDVSRLEYDQLAAATAGLGWVRSYAQYYGNNVFLDLAFLLRQSWERFAEGGGDIALRLLARAEECAQGPSAQAIVRCQAQGMRIALSRFADMVAVPDPAPTVPDKPRGFLALAKAYGLVMSDQVEKATAALSEARCLLQRAEDARELLYLLNIAALGSLKRGDPRHALTLEYQIKAHAKRLPRPDWRLHYVNRINIARLERRLGHLDESRRAYAAAFATTLGSRSEGEALYTNLCDARLSTERGEHQTALLCWLRAALHWVAASAPEALSRRVAMAVTRGAMTTRLDLDEQVCSALLTQLAAAASLAGLAGSERIGHGDGTHAPAFVRADAPHATRSPRPDFAVGAPGWSLLTVARHDAALIAARPSSRRLRAALVHILTAMIDAPRLAEARALVLDDRLGQEIARTPHELLESALRLDVPNVWFDGHPPLELGTEPRNRLRRSLRVGLGAAVDTIERSRRGAIVTFRRGRAHRALPEDLAAALDTSGRRRSVADLSTMLATPRGYDDLLAELRALEAEHILYLTCSEETCAEAGISWPLKASLPATSHPSTSVPRR